MSVLGSASIDDQTVAGPLLRVTEISRYFGSSRALRKVSFELAPGEIVALCGANGAGKSTLLMCLSGLTSPEAGTIVFPQHSVTRPKVGFVGALSMLYPDLTVAENLRLFAKLHDAPSAERSVSETVRLLGLAEMLAKRVRHCSQGTIARAAIARALLGKPELLLLDEPFAHLDADGRALLVGLLAQLSEQRVAIIVSTHDEAILARLPVRTLRLERGSIVEESRLQPSLEVDSAR